MAGMRRHRSKILSVHCDSGKVDKLVQNNQMSTDYQNSQESI